MALLAVHALAGVFWAGSTFVTVRAGGESTPRLFRAQMGAATLAVLAGIALWGILHRGPEGPMETTLGIGALCAIVAGGVQGMLHRSSPALSHRIAAGLLAVTVVCMVIARYTG
jgi:hypothetical protein